MVFFSKKKEEEYDEENYVPFTCDPKQEKMWESNLKQNIENSNNGIAIVDELGCVIHQNSKLNELCQSKNAKEIFDIIDEYSIEKLRVFFSKEKYRSRSTKFYARIKNSAEQDFEENLKKAVISVLPVSNLSIIVLDMNETEETEKIINIDLLTNLKDKTTAEEILKFECARTKTLKKSFAFGIISIDYFKELNKEYGFQKGNKVIENVSGIIENSIRDVDWCARWFGVEFAVFIDNEEKESAVKILENIKHKIHNKKFGIGELLSVTVSIGVKYIASGETITPDKLTDKAREALIKAQELGRDTVYIN